MFDYDKIIETKGKDHQCIKAMEECGELIQAIAKSMNDKNNIEKQLHLTEEIADVEIMIDQLKIIFDVDNEILASHKNYKLRKAMNSLEVMNE